MKRLSEAAWLAIATAVYAALMSIYVIENEMVRGMFL